jgi:hypothetical protein
LGFAAAESVAPVAVIPEAEPPVTLGRAGLIVSVPLAVLPLYEAVMLACVLLHTVDVLIVKPTLVVPAATSTDEATAAAALLLLKLTVAPPLGAAAVSVTSPVIEVPAVTLLLLGNVTLPTWTMVVETNVAVGLRLPFIVSVQGLPELQPDAELLLQEENVHPLAAVAFSVTAVPLT